MVWFMMFQHMGMMWNYCTSRDISMIIPGLSVRVSVHHRYLDFHHTASLTRDAERDCTVTQKAKDWHGLEIFCKIDRVHRPKVHTLKLGTRSRVDV